MSESVLGQIKERLKRVFRPSAGSVAPLNHEDAETQQAAAFRELKEKLALLESDPKFTELTKKIGEDRAAELKGVADNLIDSRLEPNGSRYYLKSLDEYNFFEKVFGDGSSHYDLSPVDIDSYTRREYSGIALQSGDIVCETSNPRVFLRTMIVWKRGDDPFGNPVQQQFAVFSCNENEASAIKASSKDTPAKWRAN